MSTVGCRKGDKCEFTVTVEDGIPAQYTEAKFEARDSFDDTLPPLLAVDHTNGITIDTVDGTVEIVIGAVQTESLEITNRARNVAAQLRLYNPADANDRISYVIAFAILPDAVDD